MFGRRVVFGKKQEASGEKDTSRPAPDVDRARAGIPQDAWDHPQIGSLLRDAGFVPDDEHSGRADGRQFACGVRGRQPTFASNAPRPSTATWRRTTRLLPRIALPRHRPEDLGRAAWRVSHSASWI